LVRPGGVVVLDPLVEGLLGRLQAGERCLVAEEFRAQAAVKPLDLAGRGETARLGQQMLDPVLAADRIKEHLHRRMMEPAGEHLAVIGQDLLGHPIGGQRCAQPSQTARVRSRAIRRAHTHIRE
jgi:hypothetical protein